MSKNIEEIKDEEIVKNSEEDAEEEEEELVKKEIITEPKEENAPKSPQMNEQQRLIEVLLDVDNGIPMKFRGGKWGCPLKKVIEWYNSVKVNEKTDWNLESIQKHLFSNNLIGQKSSLFRNNDGSAITSLQNSKNITLSRNRTIIVVGGGYFGREFVRKAIKPDGVDIILINPSKDFYLRTATPFIIADKTKDKRYSKSLIDYIPPNARDRFRLVIDTLRECTEEGILITERNSIFVRGIDYDVCVAASGSRYSLDRMNVQDNVTIPIGLANHVENCRPFDTYFGDNIKHITVIGGGPTGVEMAGAFLGAFPKKTIAHICGRKEYLDRANIKGAHKYIDRHYNSFTNYKPYMGQYVTGIHGKTVDMTNGNVETDCVILSNGFSPITTYLPKDALDERNLIKVNEGLQSSTYPWLFAGGDVLAIKEEKTAAAAHQHSKHVVQNIQYYLCRHKQKPYHVKESMGSIIMYGPKYAMVATTNVKMANRFIRWTKIKLQDIFMK